MNDVPLVGVGQGIGHFAQNSPHFLRLHRPFILQPLGEIVARDESHDEVDEVVPLLDVVDRNDIRMAELGRRFGFAKKPLADVRPKGQLGRKELYRDVALEALVHGTIDDSHAATPDLAVQLIVGGKDLRHMGAKFIVWT